MKTLYLAEKPSQAMDIAKVLGVKSRGDGFLTLKNDDEISWAVGHLLELVEPQEYNEAWGGRWSFDHLPMIPPQWKYAVNKKTSKQFNVIKKLLKTADRVVIATDAGREGELIARSVLVHCGYKGKIDRFWTSSLVEADIRKALAHLRPGSETYPLYEAALARQHSDWLMGLSGTRAVSLAANVRGDYFPVGRVKTPTLTMVVKRDLEIRDFKAKEYFELEATVQTAKGATFKMTHAPEEANRIYDKATADALKAKAAKATAPLSVKKTLEKESPALPYSLPMLQKDANKYLGFTAKQTLKVAQALYEKKVSTYPRTDCQYLANSQIAEIDGVLESVAKVYPTQVSSLKALGIVARPSTFNDAKLTDHHGIIPTIVQVELDADEKGLYSLICQRYLRTLAPDHEFTSTKVTLDANGVPFKASGRTPVKAGWKSIKIVGETADSSED